MRENFGTKPEWLTFDCYRTLIQWDEWLIAAVERILGKQKATVDPARFIELFDRHEHARAGETPSLIPLGHRREPAQSSAVELCQDASLARQSDASSGDCRRGPWTSRLHPSLRCLRNGT